MAVARDLILKDYPTAQITSEPSKGTTGELEVYVNGQLVHTKKGGDGVVDKKNQAAFMEKVKKAAA